MAKIIDINKSAYIDGNIEIYAKNKIGQYSKFLNKNPIFLKAYYSINLQMSRADIGTGSVESELGPNSPIKFNKIMGLPVYNFPEIKPDIVFDESGFDIDLDLSDLTLLPNTVKPSVSDYLIFQIPGVDKELLFRVNNISYNTIQSNDFYLFSVDIKDIGTNLEDRLKDQIVETYQTIFDNIGTQDKCFIRIEDYEKIVDVVKIYNHFKDLYYNLFFNKQCNSFVLYNNEINPDYWLYDYYIAKFITDTNIYYTPNDTDALLLTYNDVVPLNMDDLFNKTLLGAIYNRSIDYLKTFIYSYQATISKPFSPFVVNDYPCNSAMIYISNTELTEETSTDYRDGYIIDYYSVQLIKDIKNGELTSTDYIDTIIFNFLKNIPVNIDKAQLISYGFTDNLKTYMYLPIVLYIIHQYYDEYFKKS